MLCIEYRIIWIWCFIGNASQRSTEAQPETHAVMDLIQEKGFTLSVALDGGSVLVTYPYDKPVQPGLLSLFLDHSFLVVA